MADNAASDLLSADTFAAARKHMVDSQVRPNKVSDPRILAAMRTLPRERFVPPASAARAYADEDVPLANGRVLMEPMVLARLVQLAAAMPGDRALVVGAGAGYGAAVLEACGARVTALEEDLTLQRTADALLKELAPGVSVVLGPLADGWRAGAPYDVILIEGAIGEIPPLIAQQLRIDGGRLVTVLAGSGRIGQAVLAESTQAGLRAQPVFDCAMPLIPSLMRAPAFEF
jgi:protein-L-isoaspartate(D-aspartate) O-methyltransferase